MRRDKYRFALVLACLLARMNSNMWTQGPITTRVLHRRYRAHMRMR